MPAAAANITAPHGTPRPLHLPANFNLQEVIVTPCVLVHDAQHCAVDQVSVDAPLHVFVSRVG